MYIVLEGIDRAGKSTQIELLRQKFKDAIFTKEPGGTPLGQKIRALVLQDTPTPLAEIFLFLADRAEHIQKVIEPNLDKLIFSDRGFISGIAYAHIKSGLPIAKLKELNELAMQNIEPSGIVLLLLSQEELLRRMPTQELDTIEKRGVEYLLKVQMIMKELVESSSLPYLIIDASLPKQKIFHDIVDFIKEIDEHQSP